MAAGIAIKPSFIEHGACRFLIIDAPNDSNLDAYIREFKAHQCVSMGWHGCVCLRRGRLCAAHCSVPLAALHSASCSVSVVCVAALRCAAWPAATSTMPVVASRGC
jgi:hypothetical protein